MNLGWWPVAAVAEMAAAKAASTMTEAVTEMMVEAAVAVAAQLRRQGGCGPSKRAYLRRDRWIFAETDGSSPRQAGEGLLVLRTWE